MIVGNKLRAGGGIFAVPISIRLSVCLAGGGEAVADRLMVACGKDDDGVPLAVGLGESVAHDVVQGAGMLSFLVGDVIFASVQ